MDPLISVIIPTYNFGHLLGFAVESVKMQSYTNWDCIIVDDGSTDDTEKVVEKLITTYPRITYVKQRNQGPAQARNEGLMRAKGEYIQFLDADDMLQPEKLREQAKILIHNTQVDVVYSPAFVFFSDAIDPSVQLNTFEENRDYRPKITGKGKDVVKAFLKNSIFPATSLIRHSAIKEMNFLNKDLIQSEDWDLYLRMAWAGKYFYFLNNTATASSVLIRKHPDNNTRNFFRLQYYVVKMRMLFATYCTDKDLLNYNRDLINQDLEQLVNEVVKSLKNGKRKLAINQAFKIIGLKMSLRYSIYAFASIFLSAKSFDRLTEVSLRKLVRQH